MAVTLALSFDRSGGFWGDSGGGYVGGSDSSSPWQK